MKNIYFSRYAKTGLFALACLMLTSCDTAPKSHTYKPAAKPKESKASAAPAPTEAAATSSTSTSALAVSTTATGTDAQSLKEGILLYNNGDYNAAIKLLAVPTIVNSKNKAIKLEALKYSAFSYCVTSKAQLCRQQFERAFKLDPGFDLSPAEIGHPIWGPEFSRAKNSQKR